MWYEGLLQWSAWQIVAATVVLTQITIVSVTIYLHRHSAHNAIDIHPALAHFFRFWLWLTTGIITQQWTAIHRKHHAKCETEQDPHSPVQKGLAKVLWQGAELYQVAGTPEILKRYGQRCPQDWIERHLYTHHSYLGVAIMAALNMLFFGVAGITVWAVQMIWIPLFAAGVINGIGHYWGYRNFECTDNARNLTPWAVLIGGEELHNNHHTYPNSPKLSVKSWEFDIGWAWIRLFQALRLVKPKPVGPVVHRIPGKEKLDVETVMAIINNRFQIMAQYRKKVFKPVLRDQADQLSKKEFGLIRRVKKFMYREQSLIAQQDRDHLQEILVNYEILNLIHQKSLELQELWRRQPGVKNQDRLQNLAEWCRQADQSGVSALEEFAAWLRAFSLPVAAR